MCRKLVVENYINKVKHQKWYVNVPYAFAHLKNKAVTVNELALLPEELCTKLSDGSLIKCFKEKISLFQSFPSFPFNSCI